MFPLPSNFFKKVQLTPARVTAYESMLNAQLQDALRVYCDSYARGQGATGGEKLELPWKCVGGVGRLKTYKVAGSEPRQGSQLGDVGSFLQSYRTFGKIQGFYKDILGVHHAESTIEFRNQQKILYPDTLDAAVLHTIRSSTQHQHQQHAQQPQPQQTRQEQYFSIKWVVTSSPSSEIRKRDCCYVEMLGFTNDRYGREIGFCVSASVAIPECPDMLEAQQVTRFRMRNTMLIVPTEDAQSTSEIFVMGVKEVVDSSLGTNAHHRHFMAILNDMSLVIDSQNITKHILIPRTEWVPDRERKECSICCRGFNFFFRRRHHCRLCGEVICRTCFVKRSVPNAMRIDEGVKVAAVTEIAQDKFCVRCVMGLRAVDRRIENFTQQMYKGMCIYKGISLWKCVTNFVFALLCIAVNSLRVLGRDSSISSDIGVAIPVSMDAQQISVCSSGKSGALSARSSSADSSLRGSARNSARGSSITYYKRGSHKKKILRLEDLIRFPVEQPEDTELHLTDDEVDDDDYDIMQVDTNKMAPIRLMSNEKGMAELYNRLVRLSQSSNSGRGGASKANVSIAELRQSIADQEALLREIRQSLS